MVATSGYDQVGVYLGSGDGVFQNEVLYPVSDGVNAVATGDFNGDGALDVVASSSHSDSVSVLLNDGSGLFSPIGRAFAWCEYQPLWRSP